MRNSKNFRECCKEDSSPVLSFSLIYLLLQLCSRVAFLYKREYDRNIFYDNFIFQLIVTPLVLSDVYFKFVQNIVFPFVFTVGSELSQTLPESQAGTCYVTESVALINCRSFPIIITDIPDSIINWHCFHCFNRRHKHLYLHITQRWFSKILLDFIAVASKVHGCLMPSIPIVVSSTHFIASLYIFLAR